MDADQQLATRALRVNGSQLGKCIGQTVHLIGTGIQAAGSSLKLKACDGRTVTAFLQSGPVNGRTDCILEIIGTAVDGQTIKATEIIPHEEWTDMDMETYSIALEAIHSNEGLRNYVLGYPN